MKLRYDEVLSRIERRMEERGTWQGKKVKIPQNHEKVSHNRKNVTP